MPYKDIEQKRARNREYHALRKAAGYVRPKRDRTEYRKAYYEKNKEKLKAASLDYYHTHKETLKPKRNATAAVYRAENKAAINQRSRAYAEANKDNIKERQRNFRQQHKGKVNAWARAYQLRKMQRTPAWLDQDHHWFITEIYELAALRSKTTHIVWHVEHIVPLKGHDVSGLYVPWNM